MSAPGQPIAHEIFDRSLARARLERALRAFTQESGADFLLQRATGELADRLSLVKRTFGVAVDLGTPGPHAAMALAGDTRIGFVLRAAPTAEGIGEGTYARIVADEERSPLADASCDLIVSILALQGVNDLPGALIQIRRALRPDGLFLGCVMGGESLNELRQSLTAAESEIRSGASPRVAPFADVRVLGALLQRAGFALPVVDLDRAVTRYGDMLAVMRDLRAMGAANALVARSRAPLRRDVLFRAAEIYAGRFADADGRLRATFDMVWLAGWAPHESQQKPLKPGSATMRLEDALRGPGEGGGQGFG
ncbi:methyltransferase domain-containing protein [Methylocapsa sp. S129]|uniref:methyltransferase domain-containing protein n=1 Tax=Methylocapsa sp. S129 TaxID=1641869 RepID=UPI001FEDAE17|nr:methyltransferase domain-containing protein [Methylocapsa sp. S129]